MSSRLTYNANFNWADEVNEEVARGSLPEFAPAAPSLPTKPSQPSAPPSSSSSTTSSRTTQSSLPVLKLSDLRERFETTPSQDGKASLPPLPPFFPLSSPQFKSCIANISVEIQDRKAMENDRALCYPAFGGQSGYFCSA
jgi:hypothetical protein